MTAQEKRQKAVSVAKKRVRKNSYTQGYRRIFVDGYPKAGDNVKGFSDCSAFVRWVLNHVIDFDIGKNTNYQVKNRAKGTLVEKASPSQTYPTESLLKPGDCIYWKGTPSHEWGVGHVEMYIGNGQCIGHGSGTGPTIKTLKSYSRNRGSGSKKYLCTIRWIADDEAPIKLGDRLLKIGSEGEDVKELQKLLKQLKYDLGKYGTNKDGIDGEFGSKTKEAVKEFEKTINVKADGIADIEVINAIMKSTKASLGQVVVTGALVNIRAGAGTEHKIIGVAKKGDKFELTGDDTEHWYGIRHKEQDCYISAKYTAKI